MINRKRVALYCNDPSLAVQSQKDEADINNIVRSFGVTGQVPVSTRLPQYGDFDQVNDYRQALELIRAAEKAFLEVPSHIRAEFNHDAAAFSDFVANPANLAKVREWGLAPTPAAQPSTAAQEQQARTQ